MTTKIDRKLHKLDASGQAVGRLASQVAMLLRGKNKASFEPHLDRGDIVEVSNINLLKFTGKKFEQKTYIRHSGYPGGLKETLMKKVFQKDPGEVLRKAVREMLPPIKFRTDMLRRLIIK
jgi:large subunit ribosomal protein L13